MIVGLMFKFREACIYIYIWGKRKPKLYQMKRLDVSSKTHFSFY